MRVERKTTRITGRMCVAVLMTCLLVRVSVAQEPPPKSGELRAEILEFSKKTADLSESSPDEQREQKKAAAKNHMTDHKGMMADMRNHMGPYTPRELYPSLMQLPKLSSEKREKIERLAGSRMQVGLQILTRGEAALAEATKKNNFNEMQQAAREMQAGVARYESGLAALKALEGGQRPQEIALSWLQSEMNLAPAPPSESRILIWGMTPFHTIMCSILTLFAAAIVWMYFLRMRRVSALLQQLKPSDISGVKQSATESRFFAQPMTTMKTQSGSWSGDLRVVSIFSETANVKTFRLSDPRSSLIPFQYLPGQFLQFKLEIDGKPVQRSYTIASSPTRSSYIEITVKREEQGTVSLYLHDHVKVGDLIHVSGPAGKFTFTGSEENSIVLIGGGVGITPLMSVVRALTDSSWDKEIYFLYTCQTPEEFIFREELDYLQRRNPNLKLVVSFSRIKKKIEGFHLGRITKELIADSVPDLAGRRIHICGTPSMALSVKEMLTALGVSPSDIRQEAFGGILRTPERKDENPVSDENAPIVTFSQSDKSGPLITDTTILEAAETMDVDIDYSCRAGICGTCKVKLNAGAVSMEVEDGLLSEEKAEGMILACQAKSDVNVDVEA